MPMIWVSVKVFPYALLVPLFRQGVCVMAMPKQRTVALPRIGKAD